jgi:imidazolonepropionase-like amidohydrolase
MKPAALMVLILAMAGGAPAESYRFGKIWDGERVLTNAVIVVENGRIKSIGEQTGPAVDMTKYTAVPGLVDVHTHMTYLMGDIAKLGQAGRSAATVYLSQENARKTLETGVTTVRNLGAQDYQDIAMRDLINAGLMKGPRMFVSGYGLFISRGATPGPGTADGAAEVMKVVRRQVAAGADVIKMYGSTGSGQDVTGFETFTYEEMKAAVDAAHALGKRIAIHTYGPAGARDAIRAGADSLEHATDMDDETIAELARRRIFYVPTIDHNRYYVDNAKMLGYPAGATAPLNDYIARNLETARKAVKAGVRHGVRCGVHDVRREFPRTGLVREGRDDAGAGAANGDRRRRGTAGNGESAGPSEARLFSRYRGGGGRSAGRYRRGDFEGTLGDEGRGSGGG